MELSSQIKKYRNNMNLSQEELAEKVYVTRQTISNWENNKNYPDIHSLLLLSSLFDISLDQLIKGDINIMKEEINNDDLQQFNRDSVVFTILMLVTLVCPVPLVRFLSYYGMIIIAVIFAVTLFYAVRIEKYKKNHNIQTYKEIVAFTEGKRLDELEKAQEYGKRPYQKVLAAVASGLIAAVVFAIFYMILK